MRHEYPHMLYLGGKLDAEHVIVADAGEEAHAKGNGFVRFKAKAAKQADDETPADTPAPDSLQSPPDIATKPKGKPGRKPKAK